MTDGKFSFLRHCKQNIERLPQNTTVYLTMTTSIAKTEQATDIQHSSYDYLFGMIIENYR